MLLRLVTPHIITSGSIFITWWKRWYDRKWTMNKLKTRQVLQEDYEEMNSGSEFTLDSRYASALTTIFMVMMYSPGMPMMYVIGFAYFFITYWTDKALLLKWYKKPPPYTLHLASKTRKVMKFCLIPHFVIGLIMFSNSSIITPESIKQLSIYNFLYANNRYLNSFRYQNVHSAIFLTALFLFLIVMILRFTLYCCFRELHQVCCKKIKKYLRPEEI